MSQEKALIHTLNVVGEDVSAEHSASSAAATDYQSFLMIDYESNSFLPFVTGHARLVLSSNDNSLTIHYSPDREWRNRETINMESYAQRYAFNFTTIKVTGLAHLTLHNPSAMLGCDIPRRRRRRVAAEKWLDRLKLFASRGGRLSLHQGTQRLKVRHLQIESKDHATISCLYLYGRNVTSKTLVHSKIEGLMILHKLDTICDATSRMGRIKTGHDVRHEHRDSTTGEKVFVRGTARISTIEKTFDSELDENVIEEVSSSSGRSLDDDESSMMLSELQDPDPVMMGLLRANDAPLLEDDEYDDEDEDEDEDEPDLLDDYWFDPMHGSIEFHWQGRSRRRINELEQAAIVAAQREQELREELRKQPAKDERKRKLEQFEAKQKKERKPDEEDASLPESNTCTLCCEAFDSTRRRAVFVDCGHASTCYECAKKAYMENGKCPFCRTDAKHMVVELRM